LHRQENSRIRRETVNGRSVYVKQHLPAGWLQTPNIVRARAAREVEIVNRVAGLPGFTGRLGVMRIVEADPSKAEVVTEEVPGESLQDVLRWGRRKTLRGSCVWALYLAGKWLRVFQTLPTNSEVTVSAPSDPEDLLAYCDLRLKTLMDLGYRWPSVSQRRHVLPWLERRIEATSTEQLRKVWCHCDYAPGNLIWDGRVLTPIDFAMCRLELPLVDLTYLIHRLEMLPIQFPWRRWPLALWRKACLRGYGVADAEQLPIYEALMVRHLLCRVQTYVRRKPENIKQRLHNPWVRGRALAKLTRLLERT